MKTGGSLMLMGGCVTKDGITGGCVPLGAESDVDVRGAGLRRDDVIGGMPETENVNFGYLIGVVRDDSLDMPYHMIAL